MLKFLRKSSNKRKIFLFLAVTIIPAFVLWGVILSEEGSKKLPSTLGMIENEKVALKDYLASYKAVQHELVFRYGEKTREIAPLINVKGEAWDRLLLLHAAKKDKIKVSDQEVVQWITSQEAFRNKGKFDPGFYKMFVSDYLRMSERDFEEEIRQLLVLQKLREGIHSRVEVSDQELRALYDQAHGERDIAYALVLWETQKDKVQVSDEELEKIYPTIQDQLKDPASGKTLTLEEVKEDLRKLVVKEKATDLAVKKLEDLKPKIAASSFEKALAAEGIEVKTLEKFKKESSLPEIGISQRLEAVVAELKEGKVSDSFPVSAGAALVKILKDRPADNAAFEKDKKEFRETIVNRKFSDEMRAFLEKQRNLLQVDLETMRKLFEEEPEPAPAQ